MKPNRTISRVTEGANPYGFSRLRKEGIEISQELSGAAWTDYNYHDPGVTILEQICFGLTDLIYRTKFDVADYLCDERGEINTSAMGLHAPADVFFGRPSTPLDYQKALLDMSYDISDVQVTSDAASSHTGGYGLYSIQVRSGLGSDSLNVNQEKLIQQTNSNYHSMRNLCEDVGEIHVIEEIDCYLEAEVSVKPGYRVASVVAEVLFTASRELTRRVSFNSFSEGLEAGLALDNVFDGPFTKRGLIHDKDIAHTDNLKNKQLLEALILSAARKIAGVEYVLSIRLRPLDPQFAGLSANKASKYRLIEPVAMADIANVTVLSNGRRASFALDEFRAQYETLQFSSKGKSFSLAEDATLAISPKGVFRDLKSYQSVQNQFPAAYGINQFGMPENYAPERKAQALQLKSYLLLFEQIMANYLANLGSIRQLFSLRESGEASYFSGVLSNNEISSLERVYPKNAESVLDDILGKIDDFVNRKSRLLDYLLAMYGESFGQETLRNFNFYHTDKQLERNIIFNKIRLLNRIKHASGDRGAAINIQGDNSPFSSPSTAEVGKSERLECVSGLQFRVGIFLGFRTLTPHSLVREVFRYGLELKGIDEPARDTSNSFVPRAKILSRQKDELTDEDKRHYQFMKERYLNLEPLQQGKLSESILRGGIVDTNYVYDAASGELGLSIDDAGVGEASSTPLNLLINKDAEAVAEQRRCLRQLLIHINAESEGMHVVEHILLRPSDFDANSHDFKTKFANRVSVIFPAWTARCHNLQFRAYAEELVRENTPAHIRADIYWLGFASMCEFEVLNDNWLTLMTANSQTQRPAALDGASRALSRFLELQKSKTSLFTNHGGEFDKVTEGVERAVANYLSKLTTRRQELEFSQRRNADSELDHLQGIERLQGELQKFRPCVVEHVQLTSSNNEISEDDWEFYLSSISIVLPKLFSFRPTDQQAAPFHEVKTIVEASIRESIDSAIAVSFHWIIPMDMWRFQQKYTHWQSLRNQENRPATEFDSATAELKDLLVTLKDASAITFDIHEWKAVLGES